MFDEEFTEEGIITAIKNGKADIVLTANLNCPECGAKSLCRNDNRTSRLLTIENNFGGKKGDRVKVLVTGSKILEAAFLLYGIPVILILSGAAVGMLIFRDELTATLMGFILAGIFFLLLFRLTRRKKSDSIIKVEILPPIML